MQKEILLVEDDPFLIDIYTKKFTEEGFHIEVASNGQEALRRIREKNSEQKKIWPDLLILDIVLPQLNGWEVLREIKSDAYLRKIKVVIFSNLNQKSEIERALQLEVEGYLIKAHYTPNEVLQEVKKIF